MMKRDVDLLIESAACLVIAALLLAAAVADAQPTSLNLNGQPLTAIRCDGGIVCARSGSVAYVFGTSSGGSGGAPTGATYITQTPDPTLSAEQALSVNATGIMISTNGTGVVTTYAGATCGAGSYVSATSASGALTCSAPPGTYSLPDATNLVTGGIRLTTDLGGTATAPTVVDDSHAHTGTTISALDTADITTGTLPQVRGGTGIGSTTCAAGDFITSDGTSYSCATPPGGGGGISYAQAVAAVLGGF